MPTLTGTVGPGFTITLETGAEKVTTLKAGTCSVVCDPRAGSMHGSSRVEK